MKKILTEGLKPLDMAGQIFPMVGIDQYASKIGQDDDLITLDFTVKSKAVANDLTIWFEKGYDWVIDSEASQGEVSPGKFLVFVEMNRRMKSPEQIMEMLDDLETLTGLKPNEWKLKIGEVADAASVEFIKKSLETSPHEYRMTREQQLNEWRQIAGLQTVNNYVDDAAMQAIKRRAGIF